MLTRWRPFSLLTVPVCAIVCGLMQRLVLGQLTANYTNTPCPGDVVSLNCTVPASSMSWDVPGNRIPVDSRDTIPRQRGQYTVTSFTLTTSPTVMSTSTLSFSVSDSVLIVCTSENFREEQIVQVTNTPSVPSVVNHSVIATSPEGVNVSVYWDPPTENCGTDLNYTVTISPPAQLSAAVVTSTSVTVTDADYNVDYTVSVVAINCAGNSSIAQYNFSIAIVTCSIPSPPLNGSIVDRVTDLSLVGAIINYRCGNGLFPAGNQSSTCGSDGLWSPNPKDVVCSPHKDVVCSLPEPPANGFVLWTSNTTVVFGCNEGFSPQQTRTAICAVMNQWSPSLEEVLCMVTLPDAGPVEILSTGATIGITFAGTAVVFTIFGILIGLLLMYLMLTHKKLKVVSSPVEEQAIVQSTVPAGPVYDTVLLAPKEEIELTANNAYGPVRQ